MHERSVRLGVNIDHIATIRQARGTSYPDPVFGAQLAVQAGTDQITLHVREDRRHVNERDLRVMRETVDVPLNLEMAATSEMLAMALKYSPDTVTLVPEKREERTTEGGLDVVGQTEALRPVVEQLREAGIVVSMFIDPDLLQCERSLQLGAATVELHTGDFCEARTEAVKLHELGKLAAACEHAHSVGLAVAAGHGIDYRNVADIMMLPHVEELNIGHAIVARALFVGFEKAVHDMLRRMHRLEL